MTVKVDFIFDSFSDSNAVLLMKSLKKPSDYLNLSPLIIDTRGELIDSREKFSLKKDIFICEGFANNNIRYAGTEVTEESDLRSLSNYHELVEDFREIIQMSNNGKKKLPAIRKTVTKNKSDKNLRNSIFLKIDPLSSS